MKKNIDKVTRFIKNNAMLIFLFILVVTFILSLRITINADMVTYGPGQIGRFDNSLFNNDIVANSLSNYINPQTPVDLFVVLLMNLGINWYSIQVLLYMFIVISIVGATIYLAKNIGKNVFLTIITFFLLVCFLTYGNKIGGNIVWIYSFSYQMFSFSFAMWAIAFLSGNNPNRLKICYLFLIFATLSQFLVGAYLTIFIFIMCQLKNIKENNKIDISHCKAFFIWIIISLIFYMSIQFSFNNNIFSDKEFVDLYALFRIPHHDDPSSWGIKAYLQFIMIIMIPIGLNILYLNEHKVKSLNRIVILFSLYNIILLFINYIFVCIIPLEIVASAQPTRVVFALLILIYFNISYILATRFSKEPWFCFAIIFLLLFNQTIYLIIILLLVLVKMYFKFIYKKKIKNASKYLNIIYFSLTSVLGVFLYKGQLLSIDKILIIFCIFNYIIFNYIFKNKLIQKLIFIFPVILLMYYSIKVIPMYNEYFTNKDSLFVYELQKDDTMKLGEFLKENSNEDDIFLGNPFDTDLDFLRLLSFRGEYVSYKGIGYTHTVLDNWEKRLVELNSIYISDGKYYKKTEGYDELSGDEIFDIALSHDIPFIIEKSINIDKFKSVKGLEIYYNDDTWTLFYVHVNK
ncbi:MAG: hypothetical protein RR404_03040 [Bacilli bacterium]